MREEEAGEEEAKTEAEAEAEENEAAGAQEPEEDAETAGADDEINAPMDPKLPKLPVANVPGAGEGSGDGINGEGASNRNEAAICLSG